MVAPTVTTQPADLCIAEGSSFTLTVVAFGRELSYHWFMFDSPGNEMELADDNFVTGATSDELNISNVVTTLMYYVEVSNAAGSVTSNIVTVTASKFSSLNVDIV